MCSQNFAPERGGDVPQTEQTAANGNYTRSEASKLSGAPDGSLFLGVLAAASVTSAPAITTLPLFFAASASVTVLK